MTPRVLVACEESQTVCKAFRERGIEAFSCDIQECSGGRPEWHICGDVLPIINGDCSFFTQDGHTHTHTGPWDLVIAHPPCTDLAVSGARHFAQKQKDGRQQKSIVLFMEMALANCPRIAVENPVGIMSTIWRKPSQIVQPYEYGDPHKKTTCLWLKGLPPLRPTKIVEPDLRTYKCKNGKTVTFDVMFVQTTPGVPRGKARSKTFQGIADAMATQWGPLLWET